MMPQQERETGMSSSIREPKLTEPQSLLTRKHILWIGILSILASAGAVVADLILQYDPQGNYSLTTPAPLTIALWRVYVGSFLGVFCIPLVITGYWVVCTILRETAPRFFGALFWAMAYTIVIGTVFHSTSLAIILVEQAAYAASGAAQTSLLHLQTMLLIFSVPLAAFFIEAPNDYSRIPTQVPPPTVSRRYFSSSRADILSSEIMRFWPGTGTRTKHVIIM
jgi:hypothetical protein